MTALPDSDAATSLVLNALFSNRRRIASATAAPSMIAPSTMLSGGIGLDGERRHLEAFADRFQFDRLDGARSDVEADDGFGFSKTKHVGYVLSL